MLKGAVETVALTRSPGFYSRLFVVPKKNGKLRPVLDLSPLNAYLRRVRFRMETPLTIRGALRPDDWATSVDLTDAYFHLSIARPDRKWLRFVWSEQVYQFRVLPFGLSLSPWIFTVVVRFLLKIARGRAIRVYAYLDDWLVLADSKALCALHTQQVLDLAAYLGFRVNEAKSELTPKRSFQFLGMRLDLPSWTVSPSRERVEALLTLLQRLWVARSATARVLHSVLGRMESMALLLPLARVFKRPFQRQLADRWSQASQSWDTQVVLGAWFAQAVAQWLDRDWISSHVPISLGPPVVEVFTDASTTGWGAHCLDQTAQGVWAPEDHAHINVLELRAVSRALRQFAPILPQGHVRVVSDNMTVVASINHQGGTRSPVLSRETESLLLWAFQRSVILTARHLAGSRNVLADVLSRNGAVVQTEWTLSLRVLQQAWDSFGLPVVDLFATRFNNRLPLFVSPVDDPRAWAVDALSLEWRSLHAYAFPPFQLLPQVLRKAEREEPRMVLVAPWWPTRDWFPLLQRLSHVPPLQLEVGVADLFQPRSRVLHTNPSMLRLHAWCLCGASCGHRA
jgi:ribonuclease HI